MIVTVKEWPKFKEGDLFTKIDLDGQRLIYLIAKKHSDTYNDIVVFKDSFKFSSAVQRLSYTNIKFISELEKLEGKFILSSGLAGLYEIYTNNRLQGSRQCIFMPVGSGKILVLKSDQHDKPFLRSELCESDSDYNKFFKGTIELENGEGQL